ncbi:hypothetical protein ACIRPX_44075 [Streptomyces sp. NPDC101225]|uniref:hypothetical protein n=1 Tax=Streptomyces sp. NPDC101225 TaxID=3366135 RepID=UPI003809CF09
MSQPHYPPHPGWGPPAPQPPRRSSSGKWIAIVAACAVAAFLICGGIAILIKDDGHSPSSTSAASAPAAGKPSAKATVSPECWEWIRQELQDGSDSIDAASGYAVCGNLSPAEMDAAIEAVTKEIAADPSALAEATQTQAEKFQACVKADGTPGEKIAAEHVIKVTGTDKRSSIADTAEVFTNYTGGLLGPHQGDGKLIASAFASCYQSENGLVTVYDKDGEILANGNW